MKQWRYIVCGCIFEGQNPPEAYPQCKAPASKFEEVKGDGGMVWTAEYQVSIAKGVDKEIKAGLHTNFEDECFEVGIYPAMSRVAFHEDYLEVGEYWRRAALEKADHASHFAEMPDEVVTSSTKESFEIKVAVEFDATQNKVDLAALTKKQNLDAIHDSVHEMARDETGHGRAFQGLLKRYFGEEK